jgi:hypothetical protein
VRLVDHVPFGNWVSGSDNRPESDAEGWKLGVRVRAAPARGNSLPSPMKAGVPHPMAAAQPPRTSRGQMRFMIKEKGGVNAAVFIEFLKRLITGAFPEILLPLDGAWYATHQNPDSTPAPGTVPRHCADSTGRWRAVIR